uniref:Uncharacterized protein n=1 Tax=Clastoptera arizonana TaxID=38151 RepID=A0A1B6EGH3_9HEMI
MSNNKTVTFGEVVNFSPLTKTNSNKIESDSKAVSVKNRFNCGSLRNSLKLVSSNGSNLIAIRLVRSKLRKREDNVHSTTNAPTAVTTTTPYNNNNTPSEVVTTTTTLSTTDNHSPPFLWVYHHQNGNSTTASSQYTLYNTDEDILVRNVVCEEPRDCKGFRKNLSGKWRRLVKKKPQQDVYSIPVELREQLKQIYVY